MKFIIMFLPTKINPYILVFITYCPCLGMSCRVLNNVSNNSHRCVLCNRVGQDNKVAFVSPICKANKNGGKSYRSIGFEICLDSEECNERITSTEKLEEILKNVNNLK
ncbi:MAG: hypothetical protein FH761_14830 [Firmicutes bacterium]|nr:hypothetical protein [Bacillota bacterium]